MRSSNRDSFVFHVRDFAIDPLFATTRVVHRALAREKGDRLPLDPLRRCRRPRGSDEGSSRSSSILWSTAVGFTETGSIAVSCEVDGDSVSIRVDDTGRGIPEAMLETIFEPFVQLESDLTRTAEGTGLGLAISRDLARGMGGDVICLRVDLSARASYSLCPAARAFHLRHEEGALDRPRHRHQSRWLSRDRLDRDGRRGRG